MDYKIADYEGHAVTGSEVSIRNTGDGLSKAMRVEPTKLELGSTVHVVLECVVEKHRYEEAGFADDLTLVNMLKAGRATIVDANLVQEHLDAQEQKIKDAEPQPELDLPEGDDEA